MGGGATRRRIDCFVLADGGQGGAGPSASEGLSADLTGALLRRTVDWASGLDAGEVRVVESPDAQDGPTASTADTVLLLRPALVRLGRGHAADLASDLDGGCELVIGPTLSGGWYLLALTPGDRELIEAAGSGGPGSSGRLLAAAAGRDSLEVGLLRAERDLGDESDLRAAAADPMVDMEVARLLSGLVAGRTPDGNA